ncbi:MAG: hypothetical protein V1494_08250 [Candidatus Diapherotrites archaeon]
MNDGFEKEQLMNECTVAFEKLKKIFPNELRLHVHIKEHEKGKEGKRQNFSVHARLSAAGEFFDAAKNDWSAVAAGAAAMKVLLNEVKKKKSIEMEG